MLRLVVAACAVVGCGRVGFDARTLGDDGSDASVTTDALPPPGFILSATPLTDPGSFSWVDLDVDWSRELAYLSSRETGTCFAVVDFSGPPAIVRRFGPSESSGARCLGVSLDAPGTKLLVASEGSNRVELWDLGSDPRAAAYSRLATFDVNGPRRIARSLADPNRVYIPGNSSSPGVQALQVLPSPPWLSAPGAFTSSLACPDSGNDATALANGLVLSGCSTDNSPLEIVDGSTMTLAGTVPAMATPSGFWSAARSPDGTIGAAIGWVGVIVTTSEEAPGYAIAARFDNDDGYRGLTSADRGTGVELWAARSDGQIDVLSIAEPSDPVVIGRAALGVMGEAYAIRVDPATDRAVIVTNRGFFVVARPSAIAAITERWPAL